MYFGFNTCETDLLSRCNFCNKRQFPFISFRKAYQLFCSGHHDINIAYASLNILFFKQQRANREFVIQRTTNLIYY